LQSSGLAGWVETSLQSSGLAGWVETSLQSSGLAGWVMTSLQSSCLGWGGDILVAFPVLKVSDKTFSPFSFSSVSENL